MANETKVQAFIHALEEGGWVSRIRLILLIAAIAMVYFIVIFSQFKGLSNDKGMDQAQIGRQLADGHGFTTKFIRPMAYSQFVTRLGSFPTGEIPDTYNAPLNPWFNSVLLRMTRSSWNMTLKDVVYTSDRVIAGASLLFFLFSVGINFTIAKRLFDRRLALLGMGLVLVCNVFWDFSQTGLPQMMMLFIFSAVNYCFMRAIDARAADKSPLLWIGLSGVGFGLMVLAHGLAIWIFAGALVYMGIAFWPRSGPWWVRILLHPAWIPLLTVLAMEGPWLLRLYRLTGNPFGVAMYTGLGQLVGTESQVMRSQSLDTSGLSLSWFRAKVEANTVSQLSGIYAYLGNSPIAPVFFISMLHFFKRSETASFRWYLFTMWLFALLGMSVFGLPEDSSIHANDLHVLFIPLMIFYGLAFLLVLWTRMAMERSEVTLRLVRWSFFVGVYLISVFPLAHELITAAGRVQWPPYVPPYIAILGEWTNPDEIITSDMPWAVAWYADRKCIWLPDTVSNFMDINDYHRLHGAIVGLYLTPISGDSRFYSDIVKGEYKEWSPFILRNLNTKGFPLQAVTALPIDNECIFYSDRNRWSVKAE
jgi:4-amino-4-deoxy-L-arabinose transferase-like glycosyltransferase